MGKQKHSQYLIWSQINKVWLAFPEIQTQMHDEISNFSSLFFKVSLLFQGMVGIIFPQQDHEALLHYAQSTAVPPDFT